jgi:hypothetical protein
MRDEAEETNMFAIKPDGKKKITVMDLLICGVLGAAWLPLGIAAAVGIGGYKYLQDKTEKWAEQDKIDHREEVKKLQDR